MIFKKKNLFLYNKIHQLPYEKKKSLYGYGFIALWIIGTIQFFIRPLISIVIFSFSDIQFGDTGYSLSFVGTEYYVKALLKDPNVLPKLWSSISSMIFQVPSIIMYSITIAVVLNKKFLGRGAFRSIFFIPVIVASGVVIHILSSDNFSQQVQSGGALGTAVFQIGNLSNMFLKMGFPEKLIDPLVSVTNNIFGLAWKSGVQILLFIAGLQTVSPALYEASAIEGATAWESFWKITFPIISPMIILSVVYTIIDNFTDFNNPYINYVNALSQSLKLNYSSALALIYFVCIMAIIGIIYVFISRRVFYMNEGR